MKRPARTSSKTLSTPLRHNSTPMRRKNWAITTVALICSALAPSARAQHVILNVVPQDAWAVLWINDLSRADDQLEKLLAGLSREPIRPLQHYLARLNLGPSLNHRGPFALAFQPTNDPATIGEHTVLVFACSDVSALLNEFSPKLVETDLWQADLVWGPTFVGQKNQYAIFGSSRDSVKRALSSTTQFVAPPILSSDHLMCLTILPSTWAAQSSEMLNWIDALYAFTPNSWIALLMQSCGQAARQIDALSVGLSINAARLKIDAQLRFKEQSELATLFEFAGNTQAPLHLLPDHPLLLAASAKLTTDQTKLISERIRIAIDKQLNDLLEDQSVLAPALQHFTQAINMIKGGSWAILSLPESPEGSACIGGVIEVSNAESFFNELRQLTAKWDDALGAKNVPVDLDFQSAADTVMDIPVHHFNAILPERSNAKDDTNISWSQAFGDHRQLIQLAAIDGSVAFCTGANARILSLLIQRIQKQGKGIDENDGVTECYRLLSNPPQWCIYFSPYDTIRTGRTLARRQQKIRSFQYHTPETLLPVIVSGRRQGPDVNIEIALPIELVRGLADAWTKGDMPKRGVRGRSITN